MYKKIFSIEEPFGNNEFSYQNRKNKEIYVPSIKKSSLKNINIAKHNSFIELDENGREQISYGLENFI